MYWRFIKEGYYLSKEAKYEPKAFLIIVIKESKVFCLNGLNPMGLDQDKFWSSIYR